MDEMLGIWYVPSMAAYSSFGGATLSRLGGYLQTLTAPARFLCSLLDPFYMRIRDDGALGALADADGAEGSQD
jgi:hypothetical protein